MKQLPVNYFFKRLVAGLLVAGILAGLPLSAGGTKDVSGKTETTAGTVVYTDMLGREVRLKKNIGRIISIRYMEMYLMAALLGDELDERVISVGMSYKDNDIDGYKKFSEAYDLDKMAVIGSIYDDAISLEKIMVLKPDIIIADKAFSEYSCMNKMIEAGLPVVYTDINTDPFHGEQDAMRMLGKMFGVEKKANEMADYMTKKTDAVLARIQKLDDEGKPVPKLYFECGNVPPSEFGGTRGQTNEGWGYLWLKLRADNIGVGNGMNPMNPEQILVSNPDVIVIGGANWNPNGDIMRLGFFVTQESVSAHLAEYTKRPGWQNIAAVKNGRVYAVHFNYTVHPYNFAGVEAMAKFLYPEEFSDLEPEKDMADFFARYMPVSYSGMFSGSWK